MDKTQSKFLTILKLMDDCRSKLYATLNLFVTKYEEAKISRTELREIYEKLLEYRDEIIALVASGKGKARISGIKQSCATEQARHHEITNNINTGIDDPEKCRKTYKHEVKLCCDTYNALKQGELPASITKGYKQQVKLIRAILDKIEVVKEKYAVLKQGVKEENAMFEQLYSTINNAQLAR